MKAKVFANLKNKNTKKEVVGLTIEEKEFIDKNYYKIKNPELAKMLGVKEHSISNYATKKGLKKELYGRGIFSKEDEEFLIENYARMTTKKISEILGLSTSQVNTKAQNLKIVKNDIEKIRPKILKRTVHEKNSLDSTFFKTINTEEKAYWLGFLYADGYVYNRNNGAKRLELALSYKDKDHVEKFKKEVGAKTSIIKKTIKLNGKEYYSAKISVNGYEFTKNLEDKGCVQAKSLILKFPTEEIVPKNLQQHFIRGYFDGDGCVFSDGYSNVINFVGTKHLLEGIQRVLNEEIGTSFTKIQKKGNAYQMSYGGYNNFTIIHRYLYNNSSVFLDRKYKIGFDAINEKAA